MALSIASEFNRSTTLAHHTEPEPMVARPKNVGTILKQNIPLLPFGIAFNNPVKYADKDGEWPWDQAKGCKKRAFYRGDGAGSGPVGRACTCWLRIVDETKNSQTCWSFTLPKASDEANHDEHNDCPWDPKVGCDAYCRRAAEGAYADYKKGTTPSVKDWGPPKGCAGDVIDSFIEGNQCQ